MNQQSDEDFNLKVTRLFAMEGYFVRYASGILLLRTCAERWVVRRTR